MNQDILDDKIKELSDVLQIVSDKYNELEGRYKKLSKAAEESSFSDEDLKKKEILEEDLKKYQEKFNLLNQRLKTWKEKYSKKLEELEDDIDKQLTEQS